MNPNDPGPATPGPLDLLITGATVVHTRPQLEVIENAAIGISGARIAFVARAADAPRACAATWCCRASSTCTPTPS